ncbi:MAG: exodeoxyribonuclease V alpha subunit [Saprospiraceae bacterium]|jgi:exodeoxyribonuclease V alpha subunit
MPKYDINDPTDLDIIRAQFDMISHEEWEEYIEIAEEKKLGYKNINILKSASRKAGISKYLSPKVLQWVFNLIEKIEEEDEDDYDEEE